VVFIRLKYIMVLRAGLLDTGRSAAVLCAVAEAIVQCAVVQCWLAALSLPAVYRGGNAARCAALLVFPCFHPPPNGLINWRSTCFSARCCGEVGVDHAVPRG
jgi:hypothetical protein